MPKRIGLSIYPEKQDINLIKDYLKKASSLGFKRVFSCLLSVNKPKDEIISDFLSINEYANSLGLEVILDVSPRVFDELGISYDDLSFFNDMKAYGIRLDMGFNGSVESLLTFNRYDLKIEINMSNDTSYIDMIMDYLPNTTNLIGSHNFYPHKYSGLTLEHFNSCTTRFKKY
ncbi:MAG: MupG family TIM beta-alpha barrel fold protein, partial [Bacilli bacterium]